MHTGPSWAHRKHKWLLRYEPRDSGVVFYTTTDQGKGVMRGGLLLQLQQEAMWNLVMP